MVLLWLHFNYSYYEYVHIFINPYTKVMVCEQRGPGDVILPIPQIEIEWQILGHIKFAIKMFTELSAAQASSITT